MIGTRRIAALTAVLVVAAACSMPPVDLEGAKPLALRTSIRAGDGTLLARVYRQNRALVPIERIPQTLRDAVLAAEDARFFEHPGYDLRAIARAAAVNLREGDAVQGGSTITQQYVKNAYFDEPEKTLERKARELRLALEIERRYSKDEIPDTFGERASNLDAKNPSTNYTNPWLGGCWPLRSAVDYMLTASRAVLNFGATLKEEFLFNIWRMGTRQIARGEKAIGGPFAYVSQAFGETAAFLTLWSYVLSQVTGVAGVSIAVAGALAHVFPAVAAGPGMIAVALGTIAILLVVNLGGARSAGVLQVIATLIKILPLIAVVVLVVIATAVSFLLSDANLVRAGFESRSAQPEARPVPKENTATPVSSYA